VHNFVSVGNLQDSTFSLSFPLLGLYFEDVYRSLRYQRQNQFVKIPVKLIKMPVGCTKCHKWGNLLDALALKNLGWTIYLSNRNLLNRSSFGKSSRTGTSS